MLKKKSDQWRFFYHYNKPASKARGCNVLTLHWDGKCHEVNVIVCHTGTETHSQKSQPHCIVRGWAHWVQFMKAPGGGKDWVTATVYP